MTRRSGVILIGGIVAALALLALAVLDGSGTTASSDSIDEVGIDMDPTGNTATSLGSIERCLEKASTDPDFEIDVYIRDDPADSPVSGFGGAFNYPDTIVNVQDRNSNWLLGTLPGSTILAWDTVPDDGTSPWYMATTDVGAYPGTSETGSGVLVRVTLRPIGAGTGNLWLGDATSPLVINGKGTASGIYPITSLQSATISVDEPCVPSTPAPTGSPGATPAATPVATPTPVGTPPGGTPLELPAGWNYACYLGVDLPADSALADLSDKIRAVYRLAPSGAWDRWFPGRPGIPNQIGDVRSYDALLILMAEDFTWTQALPETPPDARGLDKGWNSVCYLGQPKDIDTATQSMAGQFAVIYGLGPDRAWQNFIPGRPQISRLKGLAQYTPVLVLVTQEGGTQWTFDP